eukprot:1621273-Pyramimonas_sp.AAC.1
MAVLGATGSSKRLSWGPPGAPRDVANAQAGASFRDKRVGIMQVTRPFCAGGARCHRGSGFVRWVVHVGAR